MKQYNVRQYGRQGYTTATIHFLTTELEHITAQAIRFGLPRHTILYRALKRGLPQVIAALEAKTRPIDQDQG